MSDLLDRLQDMVDFKHDDMDVAREAIEEIVKLEAQHNEQAATIARLWAKREALQKRVVELEGALSEMVYDATHLSPQEDDGSHWCKISKGTLEKARAALEGKKDE